MYSIKWQISTLGYASLLLFAINLMLRPQKLHSFVPRNTLCKKLISMRQLSPMIPRKFNPTSGLNSLPDTTSSSISTSSSPPLVHIKSLEEITHKYNTFLLDMWGVMHNGSRPYDGVVDTISRLKAAGKKMIILSNSSKRRDTAVKMLTKLGFQPGDFDDIITSGEISHRMLSGDSSLTCQTWPTLTNLLQNNNNHRRNVFVLGSGSADDTYVQSAGWSLSPLSDADLILARGTFTIDDGSTVVSKTEDGEEAYFKKLEEVLQYATTRKIPMLISNPDKVRPDEGLPPMPGAIGDAYASVLGDDVLVEALIKRIGKPFREVYELALGDEDPSGVCMVGDALETDVTGGMTVGCDTIWVVRDGIHALDVMEKGGSGDGGVEEEGYYERGVDKVLRGFNEMKGYVNGDELRPSFVVPHFRW